MHNWTWWQPCKEKKITMNFWSSWEVRPNYFKTVTHSKSVLKMLQGWRKCRLFHCAFMHRSKGAFIWKFEVLVWFIGFIQNESQCHFNNNIFATKTARLLFANVLTIQLPSQHAWHWAMKIHIGVQKTSRFNTEMLKWPVQNSK